MPDRVKDDTDDLETLAGEYVVGVLDIDERRRFEKLSAEITDADEARRRWENRLQGLNDSYAPLQPPANVKQSIDRRLFAETPSPSGGGLWQSLAFWRGFGLVSAAAAVALAIWTGSINGDLQRSRGELQAALDETSQVRQDLAAYEGELADRAARLEALESGLAQAQAEAERSGNELASLRDMLQQREDELATAGSELASARSNLADARQDLAEALERAQTVLVVSMQSPDSDYRFLAVHEPGTDQVRMTRISGDIPADQDYELWLVEPQKQTVSLGVVPAGKTVVSLSEEYRQVLEAGGLLAISVEQKGGSPTGVAQGPVVAVGAPEEL